MGPEKVEVMPECQTHNIKMLLAKAGGRVILSLSWGSGGGETAPESKLFNPWISVKLVICIAFSLSLDCCIASGFELQVLICI